MGFGPHLLLATLEGLVTSAVLALTALGLSLVFGVMRVVNVAHGEFFMLGAVLAWAVTTTLGAHPAGSFVAALIVCPLLVGAVALGAERLVLRRLDYNPEATIVATIGLLYILQQLALTFYGANARPVAPPFSFRIQFPWFGFSGYKLSVVAACIVLLAGVWFVLAKTRIGLIMRATQYDGETARAFGIPVDKVYGGVFAAGAMMAALAAVLIVPIQQAHYLMGRDPLLLSFIVVIIGGLGSLRGTVVA
ncbi:MAG: branched-chain amino acid ABC transporter permease, partial [Proteobacteria bacterium]|nr:branched-chain amino acid ABC transporter permease [Pseudomonadota bacterium]